MLFPRLVAGTILALGVTGAGLAIANEKGLSTPFSPAKGPVKSLSEISDIVQGLGFTRIHEIEREGGYYEVEAIDGNGRKVEFYLDAVTGREITFKADD